MYQNDLIIADKDLRILYMGDNIISTVIKKKSFKTDRLPVRPSDGKQHLFCLYMGCLLSQ